MVQDHFVASWALETLETQYSCAALLIMSRPRFRPLTV
jgi:hypothetical protein